MKNSKFCHYKSHSADDKRKVPSKILYENFEARSFWHSQSKCVWCVHSLINVLHVFVMFLTQISKNGTRLWMNFTKKISINEENTDQDSNSKLMCNTKEIKTRKSLGKINVSSCVFILDLNYFVLRFP